MTPIDEPLYYMSKSPSQYLTNATLKAFGRKIWEPRPGRMLQVIVGLCVLSLFLLGGYALFYRIFAYLQGLESIGRPLLFRLMMSSFLTFFLMLFLSNLISSLSTLYQSPEIEYLLSTPLPTGQLFRYRFYQNLFFSTWATLLLGLPLVLALNRALRAGSLHLLVSLLLLIPFVLIPAFLAVIVLMAAVKLFPRLTLRQLLAALLLAMALASGAFFLFGQPHGISVGSINSMPELERYLSSLAVVSSPLLPSTWLAEILTAPGNAWQLVLTRCWLLLISAVFAGALCFWFAAQYYFGTITTRVTSSVDTSQRSTYGRRPFDRAFPIAAKDVVLFLRDPTQWTQGLIFLSLLVIYLGSLRTYPLMFTFPVWKVIISFINFAFAGYILATLSVRFVFPVVSLEGPLLWLIKSSPLTFQRLFYEKAFLSVAIGLALTETLSLVSNVILRTAPGMKVLSAVSLGLMCLAITSLTLCLGAILPDFKERNPGKIASGLGGLLAALAGLGYVGLSIVVLAWPAYLYANSTVRPNISYGATLAVSFLVFALISAAAVFVPLQYGLRSMRNLEV
jgi:ABC-2 type transport system permease protein